MALTKVPSNLDATVSTTQSASDNSTNVATTAYVTTAIANLSDSAPAALNTLNEIAAALGDDANYASTTTAAIAAKAPLASPAFTGTPVIGTSTAGNLKVGSANSFEIQKSGVTAYINQSDSGPIIVRMGSGFTERMRITNSGDILGKTADVRIGSDVGAIEYGTSTNNSTRFYTNNVERMRIQGGGNVGIGENTPLGKLHVKTADSGASVNSNADELVVEGSGTAGITILSGTTGDGNLFFDDSGGSARGKLSYSHNGDYLSILSSGASIFTNGGSERMRILSGGNVGIGTNNPVANIDVASTTFGLPNTSGTTANGMVRIGYNDRTWSGNEILMGIINASANNYAGYIQSKVPTDQSANRPFLINPQGGNVGIGVNNAAFQLHAYHPTTNVVGRFESGDAQVWIDLHDSNSGSYGALLGHDGAAGDLFKVANASVTTKFVVRNDGNVGIGTTSPLEKLDVNSYTGIAVNSNYAHMGSTVSGGMAIFGHNIKSDSANNTIKSANTGYHSSMIKMYYDEGITFHATSGTQTAGNTFYDISGTTNELMRITNAGKVGIGNSTPVAPLMVQGDGASQQFTALALRHDDPDGDNNVNMSCDIDFYLWDSNTRLNIPQGRIGLSSIDVGAQATEASGTLSFYTTNAAYPNPTLSERMRITNTGRLQGFSYAAQEPGNTPTDANSYSIGPGFMFLNRDDTASVDQITFGKNGSVAGRVTTTSSTNYVGTSDYRKKENVTPVLKGLERVQKLNPVSYTWIDDEVKVVEEGFLAHEVQEAGWVTGVTGEKDGEDIQGMDYGRITPLLVKAIQEQQTIIEDLKSRIETLEG